MIKIGITGEMGSGKSFCSKLFEQMGVPVFYSDDVARHVINTNQELRAKLIREFGEIYNSDGIDTKKLRSIVFVEGGDHKLYKLNEISHPYVRREFIKFCNQHQDKPYIITESALIFETNLKRYVDKVIYVFASEKTRIRRAFVRSGFSAKEYKQRMKTQIPPDVKVRLSDFIIHNEDGDDVEAQVRDINKILTK